MWKENLELWKNNTNVSKELKLKLDLLNDDELEDCFYKNIEFGTAGMRGNMDVGPNKINVYTITKAALGLSKYINESEFSNKIVVIAYDSRNNSKEFANASATVLSNHNIKVKLFSEETSTPVLSFAVRYYNAAAGIVITASHNPKTDNGFKVYNQTGAQLDLVQGKKLTNDVLTFEDYLDYELHRNNSDLVEEISNELYDQYYSNLKEIKVNETDFKNTTFVFSPLYGTSWKFVEKGAKDRGINMVNVRTESDPNGNFPGLTYPNPEAKDVFEKGIDISKIIDGDAVFTTDPDADRLGIAINHNGEYVFLNGNEQGILSTMYILHSMKVRETLPNNGVILSSIVSSNLIERITSDYKVESEQVLTGFKFIGEKIELYDKNDEKQFIFGFEESYGCLVKDFARDKDAIQATMFFSEMIDFYKKQDLTLIDVLEIIYTKFGYSQTAVKGYDFKGANGADKMEQIMGKFRDLDVLVIDNIKLSKRIDFNNDDTGLPSANVIKYYNEDKNEFVFLRPSGTEPKLKIYYEVISDTLDKSKERLKLIQSLFDRMFNEFN